MEIVTRWQDPIIEKLKEENELLKRYIKIKDEWCKRIWEIGCDYDGYSKVKDLKDVIDELVEYSNKARACDDWSVAYINYTDGEEIKENILMERIDELKEV